MYMIKDMPTTERPRERLKAYGAGVLSLAELIAIVLSSGSKDMSVIEIARQIVNDTSEIIELKDKTVAELARIRGVGEVKAIKLLGAIELGRRVYQEIADKSEIRSPSDVYRLLKDEVAGMKQEVLFALFLDLKMKLIAKKQIFVGSLNQSLIHPREVFKYAVKNSAYQVILAHNHPSGDPEPSEQDIVVTKRFITAGEMLQIPIVDHVVIGREKYISIIEMINRKQTK